MNASTSAWANLQGLFHCVAASANGGSCAFVSAPDSGFVIALMIVLALNIGGVVLTSKALGGALELVLPDRISEPDAALAAGLLIGVPLWFYLWLAYALPECAGHSYVVWMIISPLYTLVLMIGFAIMVIGLVFIVGSVTDSQSASRLSGNRWSWGLLTAAVIGILIGWHALYTGVPQVAAGPYGRGPGWFQDALGVWTFRLPVAVLWGLAKVLATVPGIEVFALLGVLSLILPRRTVTSRAASAAAAVTITAVGEVMGLVIGTVVIIVVGLLAIAVVALAFMFFAAYVMAYVLVLAFIGGLVAKAVN